jgi:hypothetical protein
MEIPVGKTGRRRDIQALADNLRALFEGLHIDENLVGGRSNQIKSLAAEIMFTSAPFPRNCWN